MKSAYELAMERLEKSAPTLTLTDAQKAQMAEVDSTYKARIAEKELDGRLTELFRLARTAFEEGGANILFLALGFLRWTQSDRGQSCRAPLLLVPVSLQRSSVRAGFRLAIHEDEARFNPTLLELLRQDFKLRRPELEGDLPTDAAGLDVGLIWRIVRTHVRDLRGWEVTEDVVLSTFSFTTRSSSGVSETFIDTCS